MGLFYATNAVFQPVLSMMAVAITRKLVVNYLSNLCKKQSVNARFDSIT